MNIEIMHDKTLFEYRIIISCDWREIINYCTVILILIVNVTVIITEYRY